MRHNAAEVYVRHLYLAYWVMGSVVKDEPLPTPTPEGPQTFLTVRLSFSPDHPIQGASTTGASAPPYSSLPTFKARTTAWGL